MVTLKFQKDLPDSAIGPLFAELHDIEGKIGGLLSITSGQSENPEHMEPGYMHGFIADFEEWDALQIYPDHPALGANPVAASVGGIDGVLVLDLTVNNGTLKR